MAEKLRKISIFIKILIQIFGGLRLRHQPQTLPSNCLFPVFFRFSEGLDFGISNSTALDDCGSPAIKTRSLHDQVANRVRDLIIGLPGETIANVLQKLLAEHVSSGHGSKFVSRMLDAEITGF